MDRYLKAFKPAMVRWLRDHYPLEEAKKRWRKTVYLDEKWIREEGDLGGKNNPMAHNMLQAYAFFAFYEAVDRSFTKEDLDRLIGTAMGRTMRMRSLFDLNILLKHKLFSKLIYGYLDGYRKKAEKLRGRAWDNTWVMRLNPERHDKGIALVFDTCPINDFARRHGYIDFPQEPLLYRSPYMPGCPRKADPA